MKRAYILFVFLLLFAMLNGQNKYAQYPKTDYSYSVSDWSYNSYSEIEEKYNEARIHEEIELGVKLPEFKLPKLWDQLDNGAKLLWIINRERKDRGLGEIQTIDETLNKLSEKSLLRFEEQNRKDLLSLNASKSFILKGDDFLREEFSTLNNSYKYETDKIDNNYLISVNACSNNSPLIEMLLYNFLYSDAANNWKNRDFILNTNFKENGGNPYAEGYVGYSVIKIDAPDSLNAPQLAVLSLLFIDPGVNWSYKPLEASENNFDFEISTAASEITISVADETESFNVEVYNLVGQLILNREVYNGMENTFRIDASKGYYLVRLKSGTKQKAVKVYIP